MDWESIVNNILSENKSSNAEQNQEIEKYIKFIQSYANNDDVVEEIRENFDGILWMYKRLSEKAEANNISWKEESKFDVDLYASMIFCAYYLQKAWSTVSDYPPPLSVSRVMGYAFIVGYRLGTMGGEQDEL
jgi:hypothetical protein